MNAQKHAAAQLLRAAAHLLREAHGELARADQRETTADYERYNRRCARSTAVPIDSLALELENEAAAE